MEKRTHPITILEFVSKYLFLLLIPVLRGLFYLLTTSHDFYNWLAGAWVDLLVVLFILLASYLRWRFQFYRYDEQGLTVRRGVLIRRTVTIPQSSISTLTVEESFYLRPFRAVHLLADTDAGPFQRADCQLTLHREDACGLLERHGREPNLKPRLYRPRWTELAFLSIIVSNTLTGVVFLATFINKAGELLGEEFQRCLLVGLEGVAGLLAFLPQTGAVLALILMGGWLVGFARNFVRFIRFTVRREEGALTIRSGWLTRRTYSCRVDAVNFLDYRQSILTRMMGLYMVFVQCVGYGKGGALAVLVPAADTRSCRRTMRMLLPEMAGRPRQIRPPCGSVIRYAMFPFWACLLVPAAAAAACRLFPDWQQLIVFLGLMLALPFVWLLILRIIDCCTAGIAVSSRQLTLRYSRGYTFHTVIVPRERVNYVRIRYSIFQKWAGNCDVLVYTYGEVGHCHKVENLRLQEVRELLRLLDGENSVLGMPAPAKPKGGKR